MVSLYKEYSRLGLKGNHYSDYVAWVQRYNRLKPFEIFLGYSEMKLRISYLEYLDYYDEWLLYSGKNKGEYSDYWRWVEKENRLATYEQYLDYLRTGDITDFFDTICQKEWKEGKIDCKYSVYREWV